MLSGLRTIIVGTAFAWVDDGLWALRLNTGPAAWNVTEG